MSETVVYDRHLSDFSLEPKLKKASGRKKRDYTQDLIKKIIFEINI